MAALPKLYTRLTRNAAGVGSYSSLWLAADHLMIVRSTGYIENYSRVQLNEIKGFFLTPSNRRAWWGIFWGVVTGIGVMVLLPGPSLGDNLAWGLPFIMPGVIGLIWNYLMGPGCRGYVATGVQTAELPALRRMKKARRVIARLQPLIKAAQTDLALPPVIAAAARAASAPAVSNELPVPPAASAPAVSEAPASPGPTPPAG